MNPDYQMNKVWHLLPSVEPEKRVFWAILAQALKDVRSSCKWGNKADREDALRWFYSDALYERSFVWICDALGIDPEWVRSAI